jgi:hypothetical protein
MCLSPSSILPRWSNLLQCTHVLKPDRKFESEVRTLGRNSRVDRIRFITTIIVELLFVRVELSKLTTRVAFITRLSQSPPFINAIPHNLSGNHGQCRRRRLQVLIYLRRLRYFSDIFVVSYSLTVFSPSGKLVQIEHALAAVSQGTTSLGIKGARPAFCCISQAYCTAQRPMELSLLQRRNHHRS